MKSILEFLSAKTIKSKDATKALKFESEGSSTLGGHKDGKANTNFEYSHDGEDWVKWNLSDILITKDNPLYIRGNNPEGISFNDVNAFVFKIDGDKVACSGNIMYLLDYTKDLDTIPNTNCFNYLFDGCKSLTTAPELPATTLTTGCYGYMFVGCSNLTAVPELPATKITEYCYENMFRNCTSLTKAQSILPATKLENYCYYNMFKGCANLKTAPELPALKLADLCYAGMFNKCTNLSYVKAMFTSDPKVIFINTWLVGVSGNGKFVKNSAATWNDEDARIPDNWDIETADK